MWIRVISMRSRLARRLYLVAGLVLAAVGLHWQASVGHWWSPTSASVTAPPEAIYRVATQQPAVALTINVVWGTSYVPRLLQELVSRHVKATFMVGGGWAKAHPNMVTQIQKDGMEIGNHGYAHRHVATISVTENVAEIEQTNQVVQAITGVRPKLFAPPYGELSVGVLRAAGLTHMTPVMWTLDTIDWRPSSTPAMIVQRILPRVKAGAIILMHPTERTVVALPLLLHGLAQAKLSPVTVSELLQMGTPMGE